MKHIRYFIFLFFSLTIYLSAIAQSSEQKVTKAVNEINTLMDELHQLAKAKDVKGAIAKLDEINAVYKRELTWDTFDKEYRNAKMANPSFDYQIRTDLPQQLDPDFWKDFQRRCDRIMANQDQAVDGFTAMVQLNNYDKMMAYGSQLKTTYETFKNAAENLGTANLPKFAYDLYGNMNDFVENYKKIEEAEVEGIDIQTYKMDFNRMMSRARRSKELYRSYQSFINSNIIAINDFNSNVKYINGLKDDASDGPLKPLEPTPDYIWNYEYFENEIKELCDAMEHYEIKCSKLKSDIDEIKVEARKDWSRVKGNIYSSDDEAQKQMYISDCEESWKEFSGIASRLYEEAYQIYCLDNSTGSSATNNSENPFDGSSASGTTAKVDESSSVEEEGDHTSTSNFNPNNGTFVGTIYAGGGSGEYAAIEVEHLQLFEKIIFVKRSGTLKHVQLIWRKQGGIWETAYEGNKTEFNIRNGIGKMPPGTTHLNFVVNSRHNRWSASDIPCKMDVFLSGTGSSGSSAPNQSGGSSSSHTENTNSKPSNQSSKPENTYVPPPVTPKVSSANKEFAELINKANESFNKPYWEESQGPKASSNPKQESLDYLVKASRLINSEPHVETKFNMVQQLVSTSTRFAQRVHAYEAKVPFINLAGQTSSRAGSQVSSIQASDSKSKQELQKYAYKKVAASWRAVRDATLVHGGTNYSKESCDREYVKYKELSER